jgi:hypothetical protein
LPRFAPEFLAIGVLSKNIIIKVYKSVILLVDLYGCELAHQLRVYGRQVAGEDNWTLAVESRTGENCVMKALIICTLHLTFRVIKLRRTGWEKRVAHMGNCREVTGFWLGNQRETARFEELGLDWRIILKQVFKKKNGRLWTRLTWIRRGASSVSL